MDQYTTVTHTSWGSKIVNSFGGVLVGILMFGASFPVLWMNEGRTDMSKIAARSEVVNADSDGGFAQGQLVSVSGKLTSPETLGDNALKAGPYIQLDRQVEMYAWVEHEESATEKNTGGSSTTRTTYSYTREWTSSPKEASSFQVPSGHENPQLAIPSATTSVSQAQVGRFQLDPASIEMPSGEPLHLTPAMLSLDSGLVQVGDYLFKGQGSISQPQIGDVRISWQTVRADSQATVMGKLDGSRITAYTDQSSGSTLYRVFTSDRAGAITTLRSEYVMLGWILRLVGFLLMWIGLSLFFAPLNAILDVLPLLGNLSGALTGGLTFAVALVLTLITVVVAMIAHSLIALIITIALIAGGVFAWSRMRRRPTAATA